MGSLYSSYILVIYVLPVCMLGISSCMYVRYYFYILLLVV
jgi:hypothetical protein